MALTQSLPQYFKKSIKAALKQVRSPYKALTPETTLIQQAPTDKIFINTPISCTKRASKLSEGLYYSKQKSRKLQASIDASYFYHHPPQTNNPTILLVGYEYETYPAQILKKMGYTPKVYFNDIGDFDASNFGPPIESLNFHYVQEDLRILDKHFKQPTFDYIFTSRGCLDCFDYRETIKALKLFTTLLKNETSVLLTHLQTLFYSKEILTALSQGDMSLSPLIQYQSQLGEFIFSNDYPIFIPTSPTFANIDLHQEYETILKCYQQQLHLEKISSSWLDEKLSQAPTTQHFNIDEIALSLSQNKDRIHNLDNLPGQSELFSTYLRCTPHSKTGSCYIANMIAIKK